jgi:serine/threonine protein kinase
MLGAPPENIRKEIKKSNYLNYLIENESTVERMTWEQMIPSAPPIAIDLVKKLMTYDPAERLTSLEVLKHPFFEELYDPQDDQSIIYGDPVQYYDFEFESYTLEKDILRELLLDEVIMYNSKEARKQNR